MKYIVVFFLVFISSQLYGHKYGQPLLDSLLQELPQQKRDTIKAKLLTEISLAYEDIYPGDGIKSGNESLSLAEALHWQKGIADALNALGVNYRRKADYPAASGYFTKASAIYEQVQDKRGIATVLCNRGILSYYQSDFAGALDLEMKALKLAGDLKDTDLTAKALIYMGGVYNSDWNFSKALEYLNRALKLSEDKGNAYLSALSLGYMGQVYESQQAYDTALTCYFKALKLNTDIGDKSGQGNNNVMIGCVYRDKMEYPRALEFAFKAVPTDSALGDKLSLGTDLCVIGKCYLYDVQVNEAKMTGTQKKESLANAIKYSDRAAALGKEINNIWLLTRIYFCLAESEEALGNYKAALDYVKQTYDGMDSVYRADKRVKIANLEIAQQTELKEKQIAINKVQEAKKKNERIFFIAGIGLLLLVTSVVARNYSLQKKANMQKDMLMKEIHHRVKNNLQVISSLLSLQSETLTDETAKAALAEGENRLRTIALVHQKLYQDDRPDKVNVASLADELFVQLNSALSGRGTKVSFIKDIPETYLPNDIIVPLGLILNELVTNSYKYAFAQNPSPQIKLSLRNNGEYYRLEYSDNGPGLPAGFDLAKGKSLGMKLITGLSKQIKGDVAYNNDNGCTFIINFPGKV